jgi:hypothetical protein
MAAASLPLVDRRALRQMLLRHMLRLNTASKEQTDENGIPLPRTRRVVTHALLDSEKLHKAINVREARIRLHRSNEEITPEELGSADSSTTRSTSSVPSASQSR